MMREIKIRAKPDKANKKNTKAAIKREQCQMTEQREQNDACIGYAESRRSSLKAKSLLSIAEREQAQRMK